MGIKILTVVVSYNFESWLDKCLGSLLDSTVETDILVVDNASGDETVKHIQQDYPDIEVVENVDNLGFGKANNLGFGKALKEGYDYVFLVNQDAWIDPDCLEKLLAADDGQKIAILSPMHYDGSGRILDRGFATYFADGEDKGKSLVVPFVNAAFWLVPVRILKAIGGFSPLFYHYGEDSDFANRIAFHGFEIRIIKEAKAYHDRQFRQLTEDQFFYSEFVYLLTEYSNINYSNFKSILMSFGAVLKKSAKCLVKGKFRSSKRYLSLFFSLLGKSREVAKTRKRNRLLYNFT